MERIMGLDLGSRTLGIAVSDPLGHDCPDGGNVPVCG